MKQLFSTFIAIIILVSTLHKSIVFAFYELEKEYVIEQLCVNKDVPDSCCRGKCFIEKQTSEQKAEGIIVNVLKNIKDEVFYHQEKTSIKSNLTIITKYQPLVEDFNQTFTTSIFHPPCIS